MISTVRLWNSLMDAAITATSGYQSQDTFNRDLAAVQTMAMGVLAPQYAENTYVQELVEPFVKVTDVYGITPEDCFYFLGATINGVPCYPLTPIQFSLYESSPIRNPRVTQNTSEKTAFYCQTAGQIQFLYAGSFVGTMQYLRTPEPATIVLTPVSTDDRDYVEPTSGADLEWPESAFNLLLAMMMQKLGLELKEDLILAAGQAGLQLQMTST